MAINERYSDRERLERNNEKCDSLRYILLRVLTFKKIQRMFRWKRYLINNYLNISVFRGDHFSFVMVNFLFRQTNNA